jgi:hypothetical protein
MSAICSMECHAVPRLFFTPFHGLLRILDG